MTTRVAAPARRALWVLAAVCAAVIIAAVVAVLVRPAPARQPAGTPQAAVQEYTEAYLQGNWDKARELSEQHGDRACNDVGPNAQAEVQMLSSREDGNSATVRVRVTDTYLGGPLSTVESSYEDQFVLARIDGAWKVATAPWSLAMCPDEPIVKEEFAP